MSAGSSADDRTKWGQFEAVAVGPDQTVVPRRSATAVGATRHLRNSVQNASVSASPRSMLRISRRPVSWTPCATTQRLVDHANLSVPGNRSARRAWQSVSVRGQGPWTEEAVIAALRERAQHYDEVPTAVEWDRSAAFAQGGAAKVKRWSSTPPGPEPHDRDQALRHLEGCDLCGRISAAIPDATPRRRRAAQTVALYPGGPSTIEVGARLGIASKTVRDRLHVAGVTLRPARRRPSRRGAKVMRFQHRPGSSGRACDPNYLGACWDPSSPDYDCAGGRGDGPDLHRPGARGRRRSVWPGPRRRREGVPIATPPSEVARALLRAGFGDHTRHPSDELQVPVVLLGGRDRLSAPREN